MISAGIRRFHFLSQQLILSLLSLNMSVSPDYSGDFEMGGCKTKR